MGDEIKRLFESIKAQEKSPVKEENKLDETEESEISDIVRRDYVAGGLEETKNQLEQTPDNSPKKIGLWRRFVFLMEKLAYPWELKKLRVEKRGGKKVVVEEE